MHPTELAPDSRPVRTSWASVAKGIAMIMVVAYHVTIYLQAAGVDVMLGRAKAAFELFPMPAFFLIAGIYSTRHRQWSFQQLWNRRLRPLLYLYVVWSVIRTVFYLVVPGTNGELGELPAKSLGALALIFLWPSSSYWFLYALLIFTLLSWATRRLPAALVLTVAAVVSTLFTSGWLDVGNIGWTRVGSLFVFFAAGAIFSATIRTQLVRVRPVVFVGAAVVGLGCAGVILLGFHRVPLVALLGQLAAVVCGLSVSVWISQFRVSRVIGSIGDRSLHIYLTHLFVIAGASALIGAWYPTWPRVFDVALQLVLTVVTIIATLGLIHLTSRVRWLYVAPRFLLLGRTRGRTRPPAERLTPDLSQPHGR